MAVTSIELKRLLPGHEPSEDACVDLVRSALGALDGVEHARFEPEGGARFEVRYDPARLSPEELERRALHAGEAARQRYAHQEYRLAGLHCADCADKIATVTGRLEGVIASTASYASEKLHVGFDRSAIGGERIKREVESLGYRVLDDAQVRASAAATDHAHAHGPRAGAALPFRLSNDLASSLLAGLALLVGFALERAGAPLLAWLLPYLAAYLAGGWHATRHAVRAAAKARFDIDVLMVVAALGAASLGAWAEGALLLFLFSLGHALERLAMDRARGAIRALSDLTPKVARVRRAGVERELPVAELRVGDTVIVRPGERVPADGLVVGGTSHVNQAPITGESLPVLKEAGAEAFAGTINGDGALEIRTTKGPEDTTLARVVKAVESAQAAKAPSHRFTDRFQRVLTPVILVVTLLVIALPPLFGAPFAESFRRAMTLLVASSPCALALATPSAVLSGIARAARSGVLIKGCAHHENAGTAQVVVFDKTGTLTRGEPGVTDVVGGGRLSDAEVLRLAAAVETRSAHPLAGAVLRAAAARGLDAGGVSGFVETTGHGASGLVAGRRVLVGNRRLMDAHGAHVPAALEAGAARLEQAGKTVVYVAVGADGAPSQPAAGLAVDGLLAVRDEPRPEAKGAIEALKRLGVKRVVMLTGDNRRVAEALGAELGVDEVRAELLPEEKAAAVTELERAHGRVIVVGDGVNDAPAMVAADVSVAMGGAGSDVALETADVALMADDLSRLPYAVALSRASRRMIVQNLAISLGVIALLVPSSLLGLAGIGVAIVLHESSTLVVVLNALRLLGHRARPGLGGARAAAPARVAPGA